MNGEDQVGAAIAATDTAAPATLVELPVQFASSGRHAILALPPDLTDNEVHELTGYLVLVLPAVIAKLAQNRTSARLWTPPQ